MSYEAVIKIPNTDLKLWKEAATRAGYRVCEEKGEVVVRSGETFLLKVNREGKVTYRSGEAFSRVRKVLGELWKEDQTRKVLEGAQASGAEVEEVRERKNLKEIVLRNPDGRILVTIDPGRFQVTVKATEFVGEECLWAARPIAEKFLEGGRIVEEKVRVYYLGENRLRERF